MAWPDPEWISTIPVMSEMERHDGKPPGLTELFTTIAEYVDRRGGWDRLPTVPGQNPAPDQTPRRPAAGGTHAGRHVQRPGRSADGHGRGPVRPQHPARG